MTGAVSCGQKKNRVAKNWMVGVWERGGPAAARTIGDKGRRELAWGVLNG